MGRLARSRSPLPPYCAPEEPGEIHPGLAADKSTTWEICAQTVFQDSLQGHATER